MSGRLDQRKARDAALNAARAAAAELLKLFRLTEGAQLATRMKSPGSPVTEADLNSDHAIARALDDAGVPGSFLSEESRSSRPGEGLTWLIDPLCGTVPFSTGMDHWGVNIALRQQDELEVAVLTLPSLGEELAAVRGGGVLRNGNKWSGVGPQVNLTATGVGIESSYGQLLTRFVIENQKWVSRLGHINTFGSVAYAMAQICLGRMAAGVFPTAAAQVSDDHIVHVAAGAMIATESGLSVTDGRGSPINWGNDHIPLVVVGWPPIHAQLIDMMTS